LKEFDNNIILLDFITRIILILHKWKRS